MKAMKFLGMAIATLSATVVLAQRNSDRVADELLRQYEQIPTVSVTEVGSLSIMEWCDRKAGILRSALNQFRQAVSYGNHAGGVKILKNALVATAFEQSFKHEPFLKQTAKRAVVIIQKMEKMGLQGDITTALVAEKLAMTAIDQAYEFDRDYYIPYRYGRCGGFCSPSFIEQMNARAISYAQSQIESVLGLVTRNSSYDFRPKGHPAGFLVSAEVVAITTAQDLSYNIFASQVPCTIGDLSVLGQQLKQQNAGNPVLGGNRQAINHTASELESLSSNLSHVSCR